MWGVATFSHCVCLSLFVFSKFSLRSVRSLYRADNWSVSARFLSVDDRQNAWSLLSTELIFKNLFSQWRLKAAHVSFPCSCILNGSKEFKHTNIQYFCLFSDRSMWPHPKTNWKKNWTWKFCKWNETKNYVEKVKNKWSRQSFPFERPDSWMR